MIKVENLTYEYPGKRALTDISFHIKSGSITALVGPNGAGKTTLLKCLAALTKPFTGRIFIDKIDILKHPRKCHKILGFLPDFFGLYDPLTVYQALSYFARAQNVNENDIKHRVFDVIENLNLKNKIWEKVGSLSRGMRQRLAMGQAMIHDPKVLLLDEPASGLDPEARYSLANLFLKLNKAGKTLVVSSHILSELDQYATDMLILKHGKIVENSISISDSEAKKKIHIKPLHMSENIKNILENMENVKNIEISKDHILLEFTGDDKDQHEFLKMLINLDISIKEFYVKKEGVQQQYLDTIKSTTPPESIDSEGACKSPS